MKFYSTFTKRNKKMPVNINIPDNQIDTMIKFYVDRQKEKRELILSLEKEVREFSSTIMQLRNAKSKPTHLNPESIETIPSEKVYSPKWPWVKKIEFAMNEANKFITTKEVVEILTNYEPEFIADRKRAIGSISSTLSVKSGTSQDSKDFIKRESESGELEYYPWGKYMIENSEEKEEKPISPTTNYGMEMVVNDMPF